MEYENYRCFAIIVSIIFPESSHFSWTKRIADLAIELIGL